MDSRSATSEGNDSKTENVSRRVEETSPELLKNTPSNIARLEDEIEQCIGRQKYLAQTRSPSDGVDVRWFFCKVPLAENGRNFRFSVYSSIYMLCMYRLYLNL
uniref:Uncharacterized protein n=1 Tax=Cannabis sativa TaxID=3483 RepID=A0A803R8R3_CANSA